MARVASEALTRALDESGATGVTARGADALECRVAVGEIPALADRLAALGATCQFLAAADTRASSGDFTLVYVFAPATLSPRAAPPVSGPPAHARFPPLAAPSFAPRPVR